MYVKSEVIRILSVEFLCTFQVEHLWNYMYYIKTSLLQFIPVKMKTEISCVIKHTEGRCSICDVTSFNLWQISYRHSQHINNHYLLRKR